MLVKFSEISINFDIGKSWLNVALFNSLIAIAFTLIYQSLMCMVL